MALIVSAGVAACIGIGALIIGRRKPARGFNDWPEDGGGDDCE